MHYKNFIIWIILLAQISTLALAATNPCHELLLVGNSPIVMPTERQSHIAPRMQLAAAERLYHEFRQVGPALSKSLDQKQREFLINYVQGTATQTDAQLFSIFLQDIVSASEQNGVLRRQAREDAATSVDGLTGYSPLAPQPNQRGFKAWIARMYNRVVDTFKGPRVHFEYTSGFVSQLSQIPESAKRIKAIGRAIHENRIGQPLTLTEVVYILSTITHRLNDGERPIVGQLFNLVSRETFTSLSYGHQLITLEALYSLPVLPMAPIEEDQIHIGRASVSKSEFINAVETSPSLVVKHLSHGTSSRVFSYNFVINQNEFLALAEKEPRLASFLENRLVILWDTPAQLIDAMKTITAANQSAVFKRSLPGHSLRNATALEVINLVATVPAKERSDIYALVREQVGHNPFENQTLLRSLALLNEAETSQALRSVPQMTKDFTITPRERDVLAIIEKANPVEVALLTQHRGRLNISFNLLSSDVLNLIKNDAGAAERVNAALPAHVGIATPFNSKIVEILKAVPNELRLAYLERILLTKDSLFKFNLNELADVLSAFPSTPLMTGAYRLIGETRHNGASAYTFKEQLALINHLPLAVAAHIFNEISVNKSDLLNVDEQDLPALRQVLLINFDLRLFKFDFSLTAQEIMALALKANNLDVFLAIHLIKLDFQQTRTTQTINDLITACIANGFPEVNLIHLQQMQVQLTEVMARIERARAAAVLASRPRGRQTRGSSARAVTRGPAPARATYSEVQQKFSHYVSAPSHYAETPVYVHDFNIPWYYYTLDSAEPVVVEHRHFHHFTSTTVDATETNHDLNIDWNVPDASHFLDQTVTGFASEPTQSYDNSTGHHNYGHSADSGTHHDAVVEDSWIHHLVEESAASVSHDHGNHSSSSHDSGSSYHHDSSSSYDSGSSHHHDSSSSYDSGSSSSYDSGSSSSYDSGSSSYDSGSSSYDSGGSSGGSDW